MPQLGAAQLGERADGFLNRGDLAARQTLAAERGGPELADAWVQPSRPPSQPWQAGSPKLRGGRKNPAKESLTEVTQHLAANRAPPRHEHSSQ